MSGHWSGQCKEKFRSSHWRFGGSTLRISTMDAAKPYPAIEKMQYLLCSCSGCGPAKLATLPFNSRPNASKFTLRCVCVCVCAGVCVCVCVCVCARASCPVML